MIDLMSLINLALTLTGLLAGVLVYRSGMARTAQQIQERVINALDTELNGMRAKLEDMQDENTRLSLIIDTICAALRSRGMAISIAGDMVSISDPTGKSTTTRIQEEQIL